jgi:quercetin dioxygenase-like cupin family protein
MDAAYAAHVEQPNPSFMGFAPESQRDGIETAGDRQHDRAIPTKRPTADRFREQGAHHMSDVISTPSQREEAFWWQGGLYRMKARAANTGGSLGLVEASLYGGFGPPLHVHRREDEAFYVIEGEIRFRQGDEELVGGSGTWVWGPRDVPHTFKVESERARALILVTPGGFGGDTGCREPARKNPGEHAVARFGLGISLHTVVRAVFELQVLEVQVAGERRRDVHDSGGRTGAEDVEQLARHHVVADDVGREGELESVDAGFALRAEDAGVVDEGVQAVKAPSVLARELSDRGRAGCIYGDDHGLGCGRVGADLLGGLLAPLGIAAGQDHLRAARCEL